MNGKVDRLRPTAPAASSSEALTQPVYLPLQRFRILLLTVVFKALAEEA